MRAEVVDRAVDQEEAAVPERCEDVELLEGVGGVHDGHVGLADRVVEVDARGGGDQHLKTRNRVIRRHKETRWQSSWLIAGLITSVMAISSPFLRKTSK